MHLRRWQGCFILLNSMWHGKRANLLQVAFQYLASADQKDVGAEQIMISPAVPVNMVGRNNPVGQSAVVKLLRSLGKGYRLLMQFKSEEAVDEFSALPYQHFQTPWVLTQVGKAHFEMVNYSQAKDYFEWSKSQDPYRVEGLEWYSTVLWHMKKEVGLRQNQAVDCFSNGL